MFEGSFVAIVTPFKNGKIDAPALRGLIEFHIESGTNGIVPCEIGRASCRERG